MSYQPPTGPDASEPPVPTAPTPVTPPTAPPAPAAFPAPTGQPYAGSPATSTTTATSVAAPAAAPTAAAYRRPWSAGIDVLGWVVIVLIGLQLLLHLASIGNDLGIRAALRDLDLAALEAADSRDSAIAVALLLAVVVTGIVFLVWLHRVWTSDRSDPSAHTRSSGLAVGGWLIPFANFVLGPLSVRDLWNGTARARAVATGEPDPTTASTRMPGLVRAWWVGLVVGALVGVAARAAVQRSDRATSYADVVDAIEQAIWTDVLYSIVVSATAVLLVVIIRRISAFTRR